MINKAALEGLEGLKAALNNRSGCRGEKGQGKPDYHVCAAHIHNIRDNLGLSKSEFAGKVGVPLITVNRWEGAQFAPRRDKFAAIYQLVTGEPLTDPALVAGHYIDLRIEVPSAEDAIDIAARLKKYLGKDPSHPRIVRIGMK
jgi:DNA-binding transcriptional regulator YiaG